MDATEVKAKGTKLVS